MHRPPLQQQKLRKQYTTENLQWAELEIESAGSRTQDCTRSCKRSLPDGPPDRKSRDAPSDRRTVETQQQELHFRPPVAGYYVSDRWSLKRGMDGGHERT